MGRSWFSDSLLGTLVSCNFQFPWQLQLSPSSKSIFSTRQNGLYMPIILYASVADAETFEVCQAFRKQHERPTVQQKERATPREHPTPRKHPTPRFYSRKQRTFSLPNAAIAELGIFTRLEAHANTLSLWVRRQAAMADHRTNTVRSRKARAGAV